MTRKVLIQADGGSRGNPGPAAYGAVLTDAETGEVIAEDGGAIGVASNNVAEYSGLIAGLRLAAEFAPGAEVEVRMDSKLVVEQMSGNWKIKHPSMKPLAAEAAELAPAGTTYTWVPRGQNQHADRLANEALDGIRDGVTVAGEPAKPASMQSQMRGWSGPGGPPTTVVLVRHGVTPHTLEKRFSGRPGQRQPRPQRRGPGSDPGRRRLAEPTGRAGGRRGRLARTPHAGVGRDHRGRAGAGDRGRAGLRRDGVRRLGRDDLR